MYAIDFKKLIGTSKLFLDFIGGNEPAVSFFGYDFRRDESYRRVADTIDKASFPREEVASVLLQAAESLNFSQQIKDNIARLTRPDTLCVFAGQQVGMLLGPMYTVLKALTSYKLARKLEIELGRPVIPCFWMATDDHDFDEIKTVNLLDRAGECRSVSYGPARPTGGIPMSDVVLDANIASFNSEIEENLLKTEFSEHVKCWIGKSYEPTKPLSAAFARLFDRAVGQLGIVPVDPNYPGMKKHFAPTFRREIENHTSLFEIFESRSQEIMNDGYHRQVHKTASSLNLFFSDGARRNIMFDGNRYLFEGSGGGFSREQLLEMLEDTPERFSPNVGLRPIAQCFAFPTVAQIVGPSEAAYFAQIEPMFEYHEVPWPVIRPRIFASLLEPHIKKIIEKLSIDIAGLFNDTDHEVGRVIRDNFPPEIQTKAEELRALVETPLMELAQSLERNDPESFQAIEHSRKRIDHELNHLSERLFAAHKKRHDTARSQVQRAASFLLPKGQFQERILSPIYFANKFGPGIFKQLEEKLDIDSVAHQVVEIDT